MNGSDNPADENNSSCRLRYCFQICMQEYCRMDMAGLEDTKHDENSSLLTVSVLSLFQKKAFAKTI